MNRIVLSTTFIIDIVYVLAIWFFDLDVYFVLSLLIAESLWGFGLYSAIPLIKSNLVIWPIRIVSACGVLWFFLNLLWGFHSFIPPNFTYTDYIFYILPQEGFWYIFSYGVITVFFISKISFAAIIEKSAVKRQNIILTRIIFMFYRMLSFGFVFAALMPFFANEGTETVTESLVPVYMKTAASFIVLTFALLDYGMQRKVDKLQRKSK